MSGLLKKGNWVLKDFSGRELNQTVALVGATGAGKSSIINLLPAFMMRKMRISSTASISAA